MNIFIKSIFNLNMFHIQCCTNLRYATCECVTFIHCNAISIIAIIKDLNIKPDTIKFLEENTGKKLCDISLGNVFLFFFFFGYDLGYDAKSAKDKSKSNKWGYIKLKSRCTEKSNN